MKENKKIRKKMSTKTKNKLKYKVESNSGRHSTLTKKEAIMALLETSGGKAFYTREQDELIVKMKKEGKSNEEIGKAVGHSEASINYRIQRVLRKHDSFDQIKYRGQSAPAAQPAKGSK